MLNFLLPIAYKVVDNAIAKIPDDAELGEKLIEICLLILECFSTTDFLAQSKRPDFLSESTLTDKENRWC